jgi:MFS family permease
MDEISKPSRRKNTTPRSLSPLPTRRKSKISYPENPIHEIAFFAILCMSQFMTQAGLGQAITPLHIIGSSFGTQNPGELSWFPAAYSLTVGTFILMAGRLGDLYGHKLFIVAGFLWFALWSLLAGFSGYFTRILFDCCRAFQGIGLVFLLRKFDFHSWAGMQAWAAEADGL